LSRWLSNNSNNNSSVSHASSSAGLKDRLSDVVWAVHWRCVHPSPNLESGGRDVASRRSIAICAFPRAIAAPSADQPSAAAAAAGSAAAALAAQTNAQLRQSQRLLLGDGRLCRRCR
jgi:hypothetical protein